MADGLCVNVNWIGKPGHPSLQGSPSRTLKNPEDYSARVQSIFADDVFPKTLRFVLNATLSYVHFVSACTCTCVPACFMYRVFQN